MRTQQQEMWQAQAKRRSYAIAVNATAEWSLVSAIACATVLFVQLLTVTNVQAASRVAIVVVEGLDQFQTFQPNNGDFSNRRPRVALGGGEVGALQFQNAAYVNRQFADDLADVETLFTGGEMTVVNKVGFTERYCDHKKMRELLARGVDREDHSHTNGWLQRLAQQANYKYPNAVWDITGDGLALAGGSFRGIDVADFNAVNGTVNQYIVYQHRDSTMRFESVAGMQQSFTLNSALSTRYARQSAGVIDGVGAVESMGSEPGGFNNEIEDVFGRIEHIFTNIANAKIVVARIPHDIGRRVGAEAMTFATYRDQYDTYERVNSYLENGIRGMVDGLKTNNVWAGTVVIVLADEGRTVYSTGLIEDDDDNNREEHGTSCGHAGDAWVFGPSTEINGGFYGNGYTIDELRTKAVISPRYTHTQILDAAIRSLGVNADSVIDREGRACMSGLFVNGC